MTTSVGDYLIERLRDWGIKHVFAYPGDGINGIVAAFGGAKDAPQFVQARHEEMAAFVLDIHCDPEVPPIPPHATYEQIKDMVSAVLKGDPNGLHLVYQGAKTKAQELIPH